MVTKCDEIFFVHENYDNILQKLKYIIKEIENIIEYTPAMSFEDNIAYSAVNRIIDSINNTAETIEHFAKPAISGFLHEMENERFELLNNSGICVAYFSCGSPIEVYSEKHKYWFNGRVEHKAGQYYFYCRDLGNPNLYTGMLARVRQNL